MGKIIEFKEGKEESEIIVSIRMKSKELFQLGGNLNNVGIFSTDISNEKSYLSIRGKKRES